LAFSDARVVIYSPGRDASTAESLATLIEGMARLAWPAIVVRDPAAALDLVRNSAVQAVMIDARSDLDAAIAAAMALRTHLRPRATPIVGLGAAAASPGALEAFDLALSGDLHPAQAALRLEMLARAAVAEEELTLRSETFVDRLRAPLKAASSTEPLQILTIGEPSPRFLQLDYTLRALGAETTGAFTAYTAFDYLHEQSFDAVVLWSGDTHAEALSIAGGMRRNTRLFHIPTILTLKPDAPVARADAFHRGLSDIITPGTDGTETAARIVALARRYRYESAVRSALDMSRYAGLMESATGLFTRDLFAAHLARLAQAATARRRPLSVAVMRIADRPASVRARSNGWLDQATPQIGSMIGRLVRMEDTAARLASDVFALALPASSLAACRVAAERVAAVIACTAFDAGDEQPAFTVDFDIGVAQLEQGESAAQTLERAARSVLSRAVS